MRVGVGDTKAGWICATFDERKHTLTRNSTAQHSIDQVDLEELQRELTKVEKRSAQMDTYISQMHS